MHSLYSSYILYSINQDELEHNCTLTSKEYCSGLRWNLTHLQQVSQSRGMYVTINDQLVSPVVLLPAAKSLAGFVLTTHTNTHASLVMINYTK